MKISVLSSSQITANLSSILMIIGNLKEDASSQIMTSLLSSR